MMSEIIQIIVVTSVVASLVWLIDVFYSKSLGARFTYRLYVLVPAALIVAALVSNIEISMTGYQSVLPTVSMFPVTDVSNSLNHVTAVVSERVSLQFSHLWLAGFVSIVVGIVIALVLLHRIKVIPQVDYHAKDDSLPLFYASEHISSPILKGITNTKIVLPADYETLYSPDQLRLVIRHEQVHANRFDNLINLLALLILASCWVNPCLVIVYRRFRLMQECACDEVVLEKSTKSERVMYSKAMLLSHEIANRFWVVQPNYGDKVTMMARIERVMKQSKQSKILRQLTAVVSAFCLSCVALMASADKSGLSMLPSPEALISKQGPRAAFFKGVQGEVLIEFDINDQGKAQNLRVLDLVTSGGYEDEYREAAIWHVKATTYSEPASSVQRLVKWHWAGVGADEAKLAAVKERMPHRTIHVLPRTISEPVAQITVSAVPQIRPVKSHFPRYPNKELYELGVKATAMIEFDINEQGVPVNGRVLSLDVDEQYYQQFYYEALQGTDLYIFKNPNREYVKGVKARLVWGPHS